MVTLINILRFKKNQVPFRFRKISINTIFLSDLSPDKTNWEIIDSEHKKIQPSFLKQSIRRITNTEDVDIRKGKLKEEERRFINKTQQKGQWKATQKNNAELIELLRKNEIQINYKGEKLDSSNFENYYKTISSQNTPSIQ